MLRTLAILARLRALTCLLVLVVALQALPTRPLPLALDNGPAFSPSSIEVALPIQRELAREVGIVQPTPPLPTRDGMRRVLQAAPVVVFWPAPDSTAPPTRRVLALAASPRGPPTA